MRKIVSKIAPLGWHAFRILAVMPSGPIALLMSRDRQTRHKQSAIPLCIGHWHLTILISFINPLHIESFWENFRTDFIIFYNFSMSRRSSKIIHRGRQGPTIQWRHNERDGVSNHMRSLFAQPFVQEEIKKHQSSALLPLVRGIRRWPVDFPSRRASNAERVFIWWCHHEIFLLVNIMVADGMGIEWWHWLNSHRIMWPQRQNRLYMDSNEIWR